MRKDLDTTPPIPFNDDHEVMARALREIEEHLGDTAVLLKLADDSAGKAFATIDTPFMFGPE